MNKMEAYLTKLNKLDDFISNLEDQMKISIDIDNKNSQKEYFIINRDIIARHIYSDIYKKFTEYKSDNLNINPQQMIKNFIVQEKMKEEDIISDEIKESFYFPDQLYIKNVDYPRNFCIIEDGIFDKINVKQYSRTTTFIGKEGIFLLNSKKVDDETFKQHIYFIKSMKEFKLENFRINKIYIYNTLDQFKNEFKNYMKNKQPESYFATRNFVSKGGIFNVIDDGKKIGLYININRRENYECENEKDVYRKDENREYIKNFLNIDNII